MSTSSSSPPVMPISTSRWQSIAAMLEVLGGDLHVLLDGLLGEVEHVREGARRAWRSTPRSPRGGRRTRRSALEQWSEVENDGHAVKLGGARTGSARDAARDRGLLVRLVLEALTGVVDAATVGELDDHGGVGLLRRLEARVDDGAHRAVHRRDAYPCPGVAEHLLVRRAGDDALLELGALRA